MPADEDITPVGKVLTDETRLAIEGYNLTVIPAEMDHVLCKITLMGGREELVRETITLDPLCPTRDEAMLTAMLGYINAGGSPRRLAELATHVLPLPMLQPQDYQIIGTYGHVDWVSYYQHNDGRIFEVHHGLMAEEISQEQLDRVLEADDLSA